MNASCSLRAKPRIKIGLDRIHQKWPRRLNGARIGLLVHPASVNGYLRHALNVISESKKFRLRALFGPQHGIFGETQDNMIEWDGFKDPHTRLPVYSLYGKTRIPTPSMLKDLDVIIIDLQDIGSRYYTFIWTMAYVMKACRELGKSVVILDRPNPINGSDIEGPLLHNKYASFVGLHPLPVRHGMTIGEISLYINDLKGFSADLHVIEMQGWKRYMWFDGTGLPWVLPSPNMPTLETATVYPGMCLLEGTNLSEGRGTTRPFEIFGAPFIKPESLISLLGKYHLPGVVFRPLHFQPTFQKHAGTLCGGAQLHITDRNKIRPFKTAVAILQAVHALYPKAFAWKMPPYEYEEKLLPIDILSGSDLLRRLVEADAVLSLVEEWWKDELLTFNRQTRRRYLIYQ